MTITILRKAHRVTPMTFIHSKTHLTIEDLILFRNNRRLVRMKKSYNYNG